MAEESAEPIKQLKTTIIRASIHCQGCKRKVEKILSQIHGVEHVDVDAQQHKVTVTGDVDADTLIRKLIKSGKNAELWPQISQRRNNPAIGRKKEIETQGKVDGKVDGAPPASDNNGKTVEAETAAPVKAGEGDGDGDGGGGGDAKAVNGPAVKKTNGDVNVPVQKSEEESNCKSEERRAAEPEKSDGGGNGGESGTSAKKKKKKKRGQSGNHDGGLENGETNESPPRHHQFPPPPALYAVSYNTAYPSSSYTASCYAAPPPHGYAYHVHPGHQMEAAAPSSDPELNPRQPLDSFELFSDENPNGCFIM